ncbi:trehalose-phosphatase [Paenarthrobacter sp. DKR-5]|uniref:trehalose-phosphatase n=1 Tax=Paenarthrobacter sp. DKR-5 TaxID=2835535 RepID=UPI001BDD3AAE|nr:trehalose-phosphatase [Paenarthrobacter sp. DKR-5]MBT1004383.1 trehalose-phosphatase [Paenarthrobacter sp. DKR-5]
MSTDRSRADSPAGNLDAALAEALDRVAATEKLLVAMDFDGTLAPIVPKASDARPLPGSAAALDVLCRLPWTTVALVSGRDVDTLRGLAKPSQLIALIGSHGAEIWLGPHADPLTLTPEQEDLLASVRTSLAELSGRYPGTTLEHKPAAVVLHTREADDDVAAAAEAEAAELLEGMDGVFVTPGKRVIECAVVKSSKGEALQLLRQEVGATAVVYAGDDTTDETAFNRLLPDDVGIKVGDGFTAAGFRVGSPAEVQLLLERLQQARWNR